MIEYIKGQLTLLTPATAIVEASGIGYLLNISLTTFDRLQSLTTGAEVKLLVHEALREDAHMLYGFADERERSIFRLLIGVSGVGANTARVVLSSLPAPELEVVIASADVRRLKQVKGVGAKTAERIIVDLKDKIKADDSTLLLKPSAPSQVFDEALAALIALGFAKPQSQKVLKAIFDNDPNCTAELAIKKAFSML